MIFTPFIFGINIYDIIVLQTGMVCQVISEILLGVHVRTVTIQVSGTQTKPIVPFNKHVYFALCKAIEKAGAIAKQSFSIAPVNIIILAQMYSAYRPAQLPTPALPHTLYHY